LRRIATYRAFFLPPSSFAPIRQEPEILPPPLPLEFLCRFRRPPRSPVTGWHLPISGRSFAPFAITPSFLRVPLIPSPPGGDEFPTVFIRTPFYRTAILYLPSWIWNFPPDGVFMLLFLFDGFPSSLYTIPCLHRPSVYTRSVWYSLPLTTSSVIFFPSIVPPMGTFEHWVRHDRVVGGSPLSS